MLSQEEFQKMLDMVHKLDEKELAVLEKVLVEYLKQEDERIVALRNKMAQVQALRGTIQKSDQEEIEALRKKLSVSSQ